MPLFGKKKTDSSNNDNNKDKNNNDNNLNPFAQKTDNKDNDQNNNGNNNNQNQNNNNNNNNQNNNSETNKFDMSKFYKDSGLYDGVDIKGMVKAAQDGEVDIVGAVMAKAMQNAVSVSLTHASKLADQKIQAIKSSVIEETKTDAEMTMAIRQLNTALPMTENEAVAPIADNVLKGFIEQGQTIDKAVNNTKQYFKEIAMQSSKELGMEMREVEDNKGFNRSHMSQTNNNQNNNNEENAEDWTAILSSGVLTHESMQSQNNADQNNNDNSNNANTE